MLWSVCELQALLRCCPESIPQTGTHPTVEKALLMWEAKGIIARHADGMFRLTEKGKCFVGQGLRCVSEPRMVWEMPDE